jgi:hypothetical protein
MSLLLSLSLLTSGDGAFYAPEVFDRVADYNIGRGKLQPCAQCIGYVALMDADQMGRLVYIEWPDGSVDGPYLVADTAEEKHRANLIARGRAAEYDFHTAERKRHLGALAGPIPVSVWYRLPEPTCPIAGAC